MTSSNFVLWESQSQDAIVARIAIAGDFLPAGKLVLSGSDVWHGMGQRISGHLKDVNAFFANLECPLDVAGLPRRPLSGLGAIVSAPAAALGYVVSRPAIIGIANNHCYDFGYAGVARTRAAVVRNGLIPLGAGHTLCAEPEVFVWHGPGDIRVGFWAAARACSDLATRRTSGVEPATVKRASQALAALQLQGVQLSFALLHVGCLRTNRPDPSDVRLVGAIAACGFDVVAASHSHRISGAKSLPSRFERPSFCFYGLGSLVSGYIASSLEREGLIVIVGINSRGQLARIEVRPVILGESGFGEVPSQEISRAILQRFRSLSDEIAYGSFARLFYREVSQGLAGLYLRDIGAAVRHSGFRGLARKVKRVRLSHLRRLAHLLTG